MSSSFNSISVPWKQRAILDDDIEHIDFQKTQYRTNHQNTYKFIVKVIKSSQTL